MSEPKQQLYRALLEKRKWLRVNKLTTYSPYPFQQKFHCDEAKFRSLNCGNRPGKCESYQTLIDTTEGKKRIGDIFGTECEVLTYPNLEPRKVVGWVRKPAEECFRITMSDGQWIECPKGHRILVDSQYLFVEKILSSLPESVYVRRQSSSVLSRLAHVLDVRRYIRKLQDYLDDYSVGRRLRDEQLLYDRDNVQVFSPLQGDAQQRSCGECSSDGLESKYIGILCGTIFRLSSQYVCRPISGLFETSLGQVSSWISLQLIQSNGNALLSSNFGYRQQPSDVKQCQQSFSSSLNPLSMCGNHIVSVKSIGVKTLYDMEVEERHNYIAAGMVHHNTFSGGAEMAAHLTGRYPEWWTGRKYDHPIKALAAGKNNEKTRDLVQNELFGDPADSKQWGTGWVPEADIGDFVRKPGVPDAKYHVYVKHYTDGIYDGDSKLTMLAYDMGKESWMGFASDIVWLDEEPPEDIMGQATRSIVDRGGSIYQTFTPENGRTAVLIAIEENWSVHNASWMDASGGDFKVTLHNGRELEFKTVYTLNGNKGHLTEEKVKDALKGLLPHEAEMRVLGEPMQGSGLIFSYAQDQVMIEPVEIPDHWLRIAAIDFGGISKKSHPSAVVWLAYDEDNDVAYIHDCIKMYSNEPADIAARIISRPQYIPMIYPHDGEKTVPGGGTVAEAYRRFGVNMFHTHATNQDDEKGEGKGGIKIEPGLIDMNARFADSRLKIFNTLPEIWEELRNYHTTKTSDGKVKIVDRDDDLISALRYALIMVRHAVKESDVEEYEMDSYDEPMQLDETTGY